MNQSFHKYFLLQLDTINRADKECKQNGVLAKEARANNLKSIPGLSYAGINFKKCKDPLAAACIWPLVNIICRGVSSKTAGMLREAVENTNSDEVAEVLTFVKGFILSTLRDVLKNAIAAERQESENQGTKKAPQEATQGANGKGEA